MATLAALGRNSSSSFIRTYWRSAKRMPVLSAPQSESCRTRAPLGAAGNLPKMQHARSRIARPSLECARGHRMEVQERVPSMRLQPEASVRACSGCTTGLFRGCGSSASAFLQLRRRRSHAAKPRRYRPIVTRQVLATIAPRRRAGLRNHWIEAEYVGGVSAHRPNSALRSGWPARPPPCRAAVCETGA